MATLRNAFAVATAAALLVGSLASAQTPAPTPVPPAPAPVPPTSPPFNPAEVVSHDGKLSAVIVLSDADRSVPATGAAGTAGGATTKHLRYFQGWDPATPNAKAPASTAVFNPGPTLRASLGDKVEIMFLNTVDDSHFAYTFTTAKDKSDPGYGCDQAGNPAIYPAKDRFPNCFHGSSTANLHFHGTHTSPDALGDNVIEQVMPDKNGTQQQWTAIFKKIFDSTVIPSKWSEMPPEYRALQEKMVKALGNDLWKTNEQQIATGQWPQYMAGAYPNVFEIPDYASGKYKAGQAPGTHWYHAHKHGSTALHALNGLAGVFIIEDNKADGYDGFIKNFYGLGKTYGPDFEKVLIFQMINPDENLQRGGVHFGPSGLGPGVLLLNGQSVPTITMKPGEVQLWRIVNATTGSVFKGIAGAAGPGVIFPDFFQTPGFQVMETAKDGVQFSPANFKAQPYLKGVIPNQAGAPQGLLLAGGNRADVLVKAPPAARATSYVFNSNGAAVLKVTVAGTPVTMSFPCESAQAPDTCWAAMPPFLKDLPKPGGYPHHVTFGWDAEPGRPVVGGGRLTSSVGTNLPPKYTIDNRQFEEFGPLIDQCMPLDGLQEWVLENQTTVTHPFHIHINPFQIVSVEAPAANADQTGATYTTYTPKDNFVWQDVVAIPAGVSLPNGQFAAGRVTIRHQFVDFTGTYVLHCHILAHEDRGMMQLVRVVPKDKFPAQCQAAIPQHH